MATIRRLGNSKRFWFLLSSVLVIVFAGAKVAKVWEARLTPEKIAAGKILFEHEWEVNDELAGNGDGLGPVFNKQSCVACHSQGGVGGSSGLEGNVVSFDVLPDKNRRDVFSGVVHANSVSDLIQESRNNVIDLFPRIPITFIRPSSSSGCYTPPPRSEIVDETPVIFHDVNSPALFGVGLIDNISNTSLAVHGAKRTAKIISDELGGNMSTNGLGMNRIVSGGIGKFGWKGQFASLEDFVASACAMELGLSNPLHSQATPNKYVQNTDSKLDMNRKQLRNLVAFVRSLPRPEQVMPEEQRDISDVLYGERLFHSVGCADCHVKDLGGVTQIYSDFRLYNLEDLESPTSGYVSEAIEDEFRVPSSHPEPDHWQTPPLWGVADSAPYFHDGLSPTLLSAIERHKGDADPTRKAFEKLAKGDQELIIEFLNTLKAPQR